MNISNLEAYVAQKNEIRRIFNRHKGVASNDLSLLNAQDRQKIADSISGELSPENLTCDGELSNAEVHRRYRYLTRVAQELQSIDPTVEFYE